MERRMLNTLFGEYNNMQLKQLTLQENFELVVTVKRDDYYKITVILDENEFKYEFRRSHYPAFLIFDIRVNIRKAEVLRQLLKHSEIKCYD